MVDFSKHLKGTSPSDDGVILRGTLITWTLPVDGDPKEAKQRECEWEIYERSVRGDEWVAFRLIGGVTGYESFSLRTGPEVTEHDLYVLGRMANEKAYWSACAGTLNSWHQQRVMNTELMPAVLEWLKHEDIIVSVCCKCWKGLGTKEALGGGGGWSHTICDGCLEE